VWESIYEKEKERKRRGKRRGRAEGGGAKGSMFNWEEKIQEVEGKGTRGESELKGVSCGGLEMRTRMEDK
jgi:hypothetical protein